MSRRFAIIAAACLLPLAACTARTPGDEAPDPRLASAAGIYVLATIDGHALPHAPTHGGHAAPEVSAATLELAPDGSFRMSMRYRMGSGAKERTGTRDFTGRARVADEAFRLKWDGAGETAARLRGDTLVLDNEGVLFAYRRTGG